MASGSPWARCPFGKNANFNEAVPGSMLPDRIARRQTSQTIAFSRFREV